MQPLQLTNGDYTLIDQEDLERCIKFRWLLTSKGYAKRQDKGRDVFLHNFILSLPSSSGVDHINRDKLDNRKENLRIANPTQQNSNQGLRSDNTLGFKGVSFEVAASGRVRYRAKLFVKQKQIYFGNYDTPEEAAKAYDNGAIEHFGEFACTNESLGLFKSTKSLDLKASLADLVNLSDEEE